MLFRILEKMYKRPKLLEKSQKSINYTKILKIRYWIRKSQWKKIVSKYT